MCRSAAHRLRGRGSRASGTRAALDGHEFDRECRFSFDAGRLGPIGRSRRERSQSSGVASASFGPRRTARSSSRRETTRGDGSCILMANADVDVGLVPQLIDPSGASEREPTGRCVPNREVLRSGMSNNASQESQGKAYPRRWHELEQRFESLFRQLDDSPQKEVMSVLHGMMQEFWRHVGRSSGPPGARGIGLADISELYRHSPKKGPARNTPLPPGTAAPDVALTDASGKIVRLRDYRGDVAVLAYYPLDWGPGCSQQLDIYQQARQTPDAPGSSGCVTREWRAAADGPVHDAPRESCRAVGPRPLRCRSTCIVRHGARQRSPRTGERSRSPRRE